MRAEDIVGAAEVAEILGYSRPRIFQLMNDPAAKFPHPITTITAGHLWDAQQIRKWAARHPRQRAPKQSRT